MCTQRIRHKAHIPRTDLVEARLARLAVEGLVVLEAEEAVGQVDLGAEQQEAADEEGPVLAQAARRPRLQVMGHLRRRHHDRLLRCCRQPALSRRRRQTRRRSCRRRCCRCGPESQVALSRGDHRREHAVMLCCAAASLRAGMSTFRPSGSKYGGARAAPIKHKRGGRAVGKKELLPIERASRKYLKYFATFSAV